MRDTGIGIPEEKQKQLFQPFRQLDGSTTRRFGGTGLGLAIVKELVSRMGGGIDVQSVPGRGSAFAFWIPFTEAAAAEPQIGKQTVFLNPTRPKESTDDADIADLLALCEAKLTGGSRESREPENDGGDSE